MVYLSQYIYIHITIYFKNVTKIETISLTTVLNKQINKKKTVKN